MLRKYRFFITGMALTMVLVLLCMYLPGKLVEREGKARIGQIIRADQEYYADNVSAIDSLDFNIRPRLSMLSGQWKCDKTQVQAWEMDGQVVLDGEISSFASRVFKTFADTLWEFSIQSAYDIGYSPWGGWDMDDTAREWLRSVNALSYQQNYDQVMEALSVPECTLYKYTDSVLDAYEFYVWECSVKNDDLGVDCSLVIDAVTLDIYSLHMGGSLFARLPWKEGLRWLFSGYYETLISIFEIFSNDLNIINGSYQMSVPAWLLILLHSSMGNTFDMGSLHYRGDMLERITQKEPMFPGYSFWDGNYFFMNNLTCSIHESSGALMFEDADGCVIYANTKDSNGLTWYLTSDPSYDFQ